MIEAAVGKDEKVAEDVKEEKMKKMDHHQQKDAIWGLTKKPQKPQQFETTLQIDNLV